MQCHLGRNLLFEQLHLLNQMAIGTIIYFAHRAQQGEIVLCFQEHDTNRITTRGQF